MKTKEELSAIKAEVENLNVKLAELTDDELKQVTGGMLPVLLKTGRLYMGIDPYDEQILGFVPGLEDIN